MKVLRRNTARVLPVDREGRVLLLHGWDPQRPDDPFWFTIGGAADPGEPLPAAAVREVPRAPATDASGGGGRARAGSLIRRLRMTRAGVVDPERLLVRVDQVPDPAGAGHLDLPASEQPTPELSG
jgi:hypothetical protein